MIMKKNYLPKLLSVLGPGIITAALVFGPSKMTITSKMGADYAYSLLWVIVIAIFFMLIFTNMSARIGYASDDSLLTLIRRKLGKPASIIIGVGIFMVATSFQAGNSTGVGIALAEATGTSASLWIVLFNMAGIALLFFRQFYQMLEKIMLGLIILMLFCFVTTAFLAKPNIKEIFTGLTPTIPEGSTILIVAFIASCFSLVGAFYQAYLVQEKRKSQNQTRENQDNAQLSSTVGIIILGIMSAVVLICGAAILYPQGIKVKAASDMGMALEPLFGHAATTLFFVGLFGASFSSLIGNATVGGAMLGDSLGYSSRLDSKYVKIFISAVMVFGAIIALIFGSTPLELIVLAQSVTVFLVPFIGISIFLVANSEALMGKYKNNNFHKVVGLLGLLLVVFLAFVNFKQLFL